MKFIICGCLSFLGIMTTAQATNEICGGTVQTFWSLQKDNMKKKGSFLHPQDNYCEKDLGQIANATVEILDGSQKKIRTVSVYIPEFQVLEATDQKKRLRASMLKPEKLEFQLKFANDSDFKRGRFIQLRFLKGRKYAPVAL